MIDSFFKVGVFLWLFLPFLVYPYVAYCIDQHWVPPFLDSFCIPKAKLIKAVRIFQNNVLNYWYSPSIALKRLFVRVAANKPEDAKTNSRQWFVLVDPLYVIPVPNSQQSLILIWIVAIPRNALHDLLELFMNAKWLIKFFRTFTYFENIRGKNRSAETSKWWCHTNKESRWWI